MKVVIETHADDAYLSLGALLRDWAAVEPLMIVTVFSGTRGRAADAERYADSVGAEWVGLGHVEGEPGNTDGTADLNKLGIAADFHSLAPDGVTLIGPLGIGHPEHRGVSAALPREALRYLDLPVGGRLKSRVEVEALARGRTIVDLRIATKRDYGSHDLFKDQGRFMYFNSPRDLAGLAQMVLG